MLFVFENPFAKYILYKSVVKYITFQTFIETEMFSKSQPGIPAELSYAKNPVYEGSCEAA